MRIYSHINHKNLTLSLPESVCGPAFFVSHFGFLSTFSRKTGRPVQPHRSELPATLALDVG